MKKLKLFLLISLVIIYYSSCKKDANPNSISNQSAIGEAKDYFEQTIGTNKINANTESESFKSNKRKSTSKTPLWNKAYTVNLSTGIGIIVPLDYKQKFYFQSTFNISSIYNFDDAAKLLVYKDSKKQYRTEVVIISPDSNYRNQSIYSGVISIEDWNGNLLNEYKYAKGKIQVLSDSQRDSRPIQNSTTAANSETAAPNLVQYQVCNTRIEHNYSADDPVGYYFYTDLGCDNYYFDDNLTTRSTLPGFDYRSLLGGSPSLVTIAARSIVTYKGDNPITNIADYIKCFQNSSGYKYSITLAVDQPTPGQRNTYSSYKNGSSGFSVGHAFLVFTQTDPGGHQTSRAIGFYPNGPVTPITPSSSGSLNNDSGHPYNIGLDIQVPGAQFMQILHAFSNGNNATYNLNSNNCVTFALDALALGGVDIATTQGHWPLGSGDDPGDLGEDIRNMVLRAGMSKDYNGEPSRPNTGTCP